MRRYRRSRYRRRRRTRRPLRTIAWNDLIPSRAGRPARIIEPGDAWIKRRIGRYVQVSNADSGGSFRWADIWNAICVGTVGSGLASVQQPWAVSSSIDVRVCQMRVYCLDGGQPLQVFVNYQSIAQTSTSNSKCLQHYPLSTVQRASVGFKVPYPQQYVRPGLQSNDTVQILVLRSPGNSGPGNYFVTMSIKMKV